MAPKVPLSPCQANTWSGDGRSARPIFSLRRTCAVTAIKSSQRALLYALSGREACGSFRGDCSARCGRVAEFRSPCRFAVVGLGLLRQQRETKLFRWRLFQQIPAEVVHDLAVGIARTPKRVVIAVGEDHEFNRKVMDYFCRS